MLRERSLEELAAAGDRLDSRARVHHLHSDGPVRVDLPTLPIGASFLAHWPIRERPHGMSWSLTGYDSVAPATFVLRDALVHSSAGLVGIDGAALAESLIHLSPDTQRFRRTQDGVALTVDRVQRLPGTHITTLAGAASVNYFHAVMEGIMRLAGVPAHMLHAAQSVLHAAGLGQIDMLDRMGLPPTLRLRRVSDGETLLVERLVFPVSTIGGALYHPCLSQMFERISNDVPDGNARTPARFYLDRRGSVVRRLLDEDALAEALRPLGFVSVRTETLDIVHQIRLFRQAEMIVAPHGAGLTNLGFCRPGTRVLELQMDAYVNWLFRPLAALRGLVYDCVLGRAVGAWPLDHDDAQRMSWRVSVQHVVAAVSRMLDSA